MPVSLRRRLPSLRTVWLTMSATTLPERILTWRCAEPDRERWAPVCPGQQKGYLSAARAAGAPLRSLANSRLSAGREACLPPGLFFGAFSDRGTVRQGGCRARLLRRKGCRTDSVRSPAVSAARQRTRTSGSDTLPARPRACVRPLPFCRMQSLSCLYSISIYST